LDSCYFNKKKYDNLGDLADYMVNCPEFSLEKIKNLIYQLIQIGKQLEFIDMFNEDIKPENILVIGQDKEKLPKLVSIDMEGTQT
jgi:serine/threonine protein kinase